MTLQPDTWRALSNQARDDESPDQVIARVLAECDKLRDALTKARGVTARVRADLQASQSAHGDTRRRLQAMRVELAEAQRPAEPLQHLTPAQAVSVEYARRAWEAYLAER